MYGLIENIIVAAIVLAAMGKTALSLYKALKAGRTDNARVCAGSCASCRMCGSHQQLPLYNADFGKNTQPENIMTAHRHKE